MLMIPNTRLNMAEVDAMLPELGFAPSFEKDARAAVRRSVVAYNDRLARIVTDLGTFDAKWGRGRVSKAPKGFTTPAQFVRWRKDLRAVLVRLEGATAVRATLSPGWAHLMGLVRDNQGRGKLLGENADLTVGAVARVASQQGVEPGALTAAWTSRAAACLGRSLRKSFERGLGRVNDLRERAADLADFAGLLPAEHLPKPTALVSKPSSWRRRAANPPAAQVWLDFDEIMMTRRYGEDGKAFEGDPGAIGENTADAYETSLNWLLRELLALDLLDEGCGLAEVITHPNLVAAVNGWIKAREARGQSTKKSTLYNHVVRLTRIAIEHLEPSPKDERRMREMRKNKIVRTASVDRMGAGRLDWIQTFDRDPGMQDRAHRLPETLMAAARAVLAKVDAGGRVRPTVVMEALRQGVAAAQAAILFRASPVRRDNLRTARMRGEGAEFDVHHLVQDDRLREVRLRIPGERVKNKREVDEVGDDDLAPIIRWYLKEVRPRLCEAHPFGKNCLDSAYLFPSTTDAPMERSVFWDHFRRGTRSVGFDMEMHMARHVTAYWILSVDPNGWADAAAVLGDSVATVRKYYGWLSVRAASERGRAKVRDARAGRRRHREGDYADAA
jgi:hypothetical protein